MWCFWIPHEKLDWLSMKNHSLSQVGRNRQNESQCIDLAGHKVISVQMSIIKLSAHPHGPSQITFILCVLLCVQRSSKGDAFYSNNFHVLVEYLVEGKALKKVVGYVCPDSRTKWPCF